MAPSLIAVAALVLDGGMWLIERARLQLAADAAANGAGYLLLDSSLHSESASAQTAAFQSVALAEANGAAGTLIGSLVTPIAVSVASSWTSVSVTLTSQATSFLAEAIGLSRLTMVATATAGLEPVPACVLALNASAADAIDVNNMGSIKGTGCGIIADSTSAAAIYLNSGTISGQEIEAVGGFSESDSGSNTVSPANPTTGASPVANPYASLSPPVAGACDYTNASFTAWQAAPYSFTQTKNVFCGNTTIGGNSTTDTFAPGVYYVVNGNLIFNNADITLAQGVTFVLSGGSPGSFQWTNYSNTYEMSAPTSGATAGILVWQECPAPGAPALANTMAGGSTLQVSGDFYAPCGALQMSNNAQLTTASGGSMRVIANTISAVGSAGISASSSTSTSGGASRPHLTQ